MPEPLREATSLKERVYELIRDRCERGGITPSMREMSYRLDASRDMCERMVAILANEGRIRREKSGNNAWTYGIGPYWTVVFKQADPCWAMGKVGATMEEGSLAMSEAIDRYILERQANENARRDIGKIV